MKDRPDNCPDPGDRDRLWAWGIHEDQMVANWIVVFALIESILVGAAVLMQSSDRLHGAQLVTTLLLECAGLMVTGLLWYVITLHHDFIKIIRIELRSRDPLYDQILNRVQDRRRSSWLKGSLFREDDPLRIVLLRLVIPVFMFIWLALLVVSITSA